MRILSFVFSLCLCVSVVQNVFAHPVPKQNHDRIIAVKLTPDAVVVEYHLEVDEYRAVRRSPREEIERIDSPNAIPRVFIEYMAPILRDNLIARLDGDELTFTGSGQQDDHGKGSSALRLHVQGRVEAAPDRPHTFTLRKATTMRRTSIVSICR